MIPEIVIAIGLSVFLIGLLALLVGLAMEKLHCNPIARGQVFNISELTMSVGLGVMFVGCCWITAISLIL